MLLSCFEFRFLSRAFVCVNLKCLSSCVCLRENLFSRACVSIAPRSIMVATRRSKDVVARAADQDDDSSPNPSSSVRQRVRSRPQQQKTAPVSADDSESETDTSMDESDTTKVVKSRDPMSRSKTSSKNEEYQQQLKKAGAGESAMSKFWKRLIFGWLMIFAVIAIMYAGHFYCLLLVLCLQCMLFRELVNVRYNANKDKELPLFRSIQWAWFSVAVFYSYGDLYILGKVIPYHTWVAFGLYCCLFITTVLSLKKGYYRYQMGQLTWTIVILAIIVLQMKMALNNLFAGLFWFLVPASLIMSADTFAYFAGFAFGRKFIQRPFLKISPNKTWEGFIGGFLATLCIGFLYPYVLSLFPTPIWEYLICPLTLKGGVVPERLADLYPLHCVPNPVFVWRTYDIPAIVLSILSPVYALISANPLPSSISLLPVQLHMTGLGAFASLVAPFGGFFASAIKRAYRFKDFDSVIPGHGGVMDRVDCQMMMAFCTAIHYNTFIKPSVISVSSILSLLSAMSKEQQQEVLARLQASLSA